MYGNTGMMHDIECGKPCEVEGCTGHCGYSMVHNSKEPHLCDKHITAYLEARREIPADPRPETKA